MFASCRWRVSQRRGYSLFDEDFARASARVSIFGKIHFCDSSVPVGQGTNTLDGVEPNLSDVLCPQPFQEYPALKRDWQRAKLYDGEICMCRIT
jgi:hypothetical protein